MQPGHARHGLANARRRLRELYGESSPRSASAGGGGVAATVSDSLPRRCGWRTIEVVIREIRTLSGTTKRSPDTLSCFPAPYQNLAVNATNKLATELVVTEYASHRPAG